MFANIDSNKGINDFMNSAFKIAKQKFLKYQMQYDWSGTVRIKQPHKITNNLVYGKNSIQKPDPSKSKAFIVYKKAQKLYSLPNLLNKNIIFMCYVHIGTVWLSNP